MPRMTHGSTVSLETVQATINAINALNNGVSSPIVLAAPRRLTEFGYMLADLQADPENLLPKRPEMDEAGNPVPNPDSDPGTVANLIRLGETMRDTEPDTSIGDNGDIPAAYTYLGQFIDHDITLETISDAFGALDNPKIFSSEQVLQRIKNQRTATLDLDSVYDPPAPFDGERMKLGEVFPVGNHVPGKDKDNDLPRSDPDPNPKFDRFALIGDARNDENLVVAQLHVAFLSAHNEIVNRGQSWDSARRILRQLYQWIVIKDFLPKIVGNDIVKDILDRGSNRFYRPSDAEFFMPLEFSVAAYRFGHSMVRANYNHNINFPNATLGQLFSFTALSGEIDAPEFGAPEFPTLPQNWVIQWENFVNRVDQNGNVISAENPTRKIDTQLVEPLFQLKEHGVQLPGVAARLAVRNLLRGYMLRMPTGQAVADAMGFTNTAVGPGKNRLSNQEIQDLIEAKADGAAHMDLDDRNKLKESRFDERTPLWFYILAEAELLEDGRHLGPVGGTIVAEVLIELVRRSADSILDLGADWNPSKLRDDFTPLPGDPDFNRFMDLLTASFGLPSLLRLAKVL